MPVKNIEVSKLLTQNWQIGLFSTCMTEPKTCLYSCFCTPCMAYSQRKQLLELTREPYVFAGGMLGCSCCNKPCSPWWLCVESTCCLQFAISGNRFIIQTRFDRRNTFCDDLIILFTAITACVGMCLTICTSGQKFDGIENFVEILVCLVNGCMLTQQDVEIKYLKTIGYNGAPTYILQLLPPDVQTVVVVRAPEQQEMSSPGKPVYLSNRK